MRLALGSVSPSSAVIQQIASAIYRREGPVKNNNPGNLVYVGQADAVGVDARGFAIYPTLAAGKQAELNQIALDINRGTCATGASVQTLTDLINCLTPPSDPRNNTPAYIAAVSQATGLDPNAMLDPNGMAYVASITPLDSGSGGQLPANGPELSGIDLTDPGTLLVFAGLGALVYVAFSR